MGGDIGRLFVLWFSRSVPALFLTGFSFSEDLTSCRSVMVICRRGRGGDEVVVTGCDGGASDGDELGENKENMTSVRFTVDGYCRSITSK